MWPTVSCGVQVRTTILWITGAVLLVAAVIALGIAAVRRTTCLVRPAGILTVTCGVLFFAAMIVEYGPTLANGHGSSVPVGVPLILVTGFWLVTGDFGAGEGSTGVEGVDEGKTGDSTE